MGLLGKEDGREDRRGEGLLGARGMGGTGEGEMMRMTSHRGGASRMSREWLVGGLGRGKRWRISRGI